MRDKVYGKRSLHYDARRTYLTLCQRFPGHGISIQQVQYLVAECPLCQKDCLPLTIIPHSTTIETLMSHHRTIGVTHVTVTPSDEDGYVGLLLNVELDTKYPQETTQHKPSLLSSLSLTAPSVFSMLRFPILAVHSLLIQSDN